MIDKLINIIGWVGYMSLAVCGVPQAYQSFTTKTSIGVNTLFLCLWLIGELFAFIYALKHARKAPLITNYILNIFFISVIIYYLP